MMRKALFFVVVAPPAGAANVLVTNQTRRSLQAPRIINGSPASTGEFPYFTTRGRGASAVCGAALVAPDILITAAHCADAFATEALVGAIERDSTTGGAVYVNVVEQIPHPDYIAGPAEQDQIKNDLMIVKIAPRVNNKKLVRLNLDVDKPVFDQPLTAMGMGKTSDNDFSFSSTLLTATVFETTDARCWFSWGDILEKAICAWGDNPVTTICGGDSGGPLIDDSNGNLVGVVAYGPESCTGGDRPAVYTRTSAYADWLKETICTKSFNPPSKLQCPGSVTCKRKNEPCAATSECCKPDRRFKCENSVCVKCKRKSRKCNTTDDCCHARAKCESRKCSK